MSMGILSKGFPLPYLIAGGYNNSQPRWYLDGKSPQYLWANSRFGTHVTLLCTQCTHGISWSYADLTGMNQLKADSLGYSCLMFHNLFMVLIFNVFLAKTELSSGLAGTVWNTHSPKQNVDQKAQDKRNQHGKRAQYWIPKHHFSMFFWYKWVKIEPPKEKIAEDWTKKDSWRLKDCIWSNWSKSCGCRSSWILAIPNTRCMLLLPEFCWKFYRNPSFLLENIMGIGAVLFIPSNKMS